MSKKNKTGKRKLQQQETVAVTGKKSVKETAKKPMLNLLMIMVAVLPFMFSWEIADPTLTVRYGILSGFVLVFVLYFFGFSRKLVTPGWPIALKIVFVLGAVYGLWNIVLLFFAVNEAQVYFIGGRHFLNMLFLFIVTQIADREEAWLVQLCKLLVVAAILHSIIGVCQFYDLAFNDLPGNFKPYGLMNNRNLFGSGQVMMLPFAIFVLYKGSKPWKYIAGIALTGIIISAILSQTRSSWLAGLFSLIVGLILVFIFSKSNRRKWIIGTAAGLSATVVLAFLLIASDSEGELSQSLKERTGNIFSTTTDTTSEGLIAAGNVNERLKIWSKTAEVIKDNPLTGVGPGNWKITVAKYGSDGLAWAEGKYVPDSPHNDYLLVIAETGIPGALLYFAMWVMIALIAFKTIRSAQNEDRRIITILMLGGLTGFAVDSLFSFPSDRIEHTMYVYLMAGIILGSFLKNSAGVNERSPDTGYRLKIWQVSLLAIIGAFNLFMALQKYNFEKHMVLSKMAEANKSYQLAIDEGNKAKSSFVTIAPNGFPVETYISLSYKALKNYPVAIKEMDAAIKHHPYNKALYVNKGTIYTDLAKYDTAIMFYKKALVLTPKFDIIYFNLAANYFQVKDYKACLDALNKVNIDGYPQLKMIKQEAEARLAAEEQLKPK
ncbi:MAG: O-antigen ligase family protein [Ferruginibacter sp.]|nr:O-antigen ligase family protein [Chitinophagaceae bacterium]